MYEALAQSGHARFMEPSDWQYARWTAYVQSRVIENPTAAMVMAVDKMLCNLMVTEADRRRVRVEIDRATAEEPAATVSPMTSIAERRQRLTIRD